MEFLSDAQASAFGRFTGEPSRADLERFFYLDDADRELISERRGDHNRLGFAVQLGTVRFLGGLLVDPLDVPWLVVDYLAAQLGVSDPSVVKAYSQRATTAREHAREIRQVYGYRDLAESTTEVLRRFVYSRAWTHGEGPNALFEQATAWLRRERVVLPGVTTLVRIVQSTREAAQLDLCRAVVAAGAAKDEGLAGRLHGLLSVGDGDTVSGLELLRA